MSSQAAYVGSDNKVRTPDSKYLMMNGHRVNLDKDDNVIAAKDTEIAGFSNMVNGRPEAKDNNPNAIQWFSTFTKTVTDIFEKSSTLMTEKAVAIFSKSDSAKDTTSERLLNTAVERNNSLKTADKDYRKISNESLVKDLTTVHRESMVTFVKEQQKVPQQLHAVLNINGLTVGEAEQQKIVTSAVTRTLDGLNQKVAI